MLQTISEHFGPIFFMAALMVGSQAFARRVQQERLRDEVRRLRSALTVSLKALRKLYEDNLGILAGGGLPLISGRNQINLFRIHFGRVISLDQCEIEAVLAASIAAERVETAMAIAGRPVGGVAFTVPEGGEARGMLKLALMLASSMLSAAEHVMTPTGGWRDERTSKDEAALFENDKPRSIQSVHGGQPDDGSNVATPTPVSALIEQLFKRRTSDSTLDYGERKCAEEVPSPRG
jgi:hypothetical protein